MKTRRTKSDECVEWMLRLLADNGPLKPQAVVEMGKKAGYNKSMIYRVRDRLASQIGDVHGHMHPSNLWQLETVAESPGRSAEDQIAALNDWLEEHYLDEPDMDTAEFAIAALEYKLSNRLLIQMLAGALGVDVEIRRHGDNARR